MSMPDNISRQGLLIVAATGNANKVREFEEIFLREIKKSGGECAGNSGVSREIKVISQKEVAKLAGERYEAPPETGSTFAANAYIKAHGLEQYIDAHIDAVNALGYGAFCVVADDSGLCVDALGGEPGIRSARFASPEGSDEDADDVANVNKLLKLIENVPDERRGARFECHISAIVRFPEENGKSGEIFPGRVRIETEGDMPGFISRAPKGEGGFGYDPVLYLPDRHKTSAELSPEEKDSISHRGKALLLAWREIYGCYRKVFRV